MLVIRTLKLSGYNRCTDYGGTPKITEFASEKPVSHTGATVGTVGTENYNHAVEATAYDLAFQAGHLISAMMEQMGRC